MKNVLALAIAAALASPMALAANTPDDVGDVTYLGDIVANSPMWQWTVNDYPGGRLDAKPSEATTVGNVLTYPLSGQAFIAASGYLPSASSVIHPLGGTLGARDVTTLTDATGSSIGDVALGPNGTVSFTITAHGTNVGGAPVTGKLHLIGTELRGYRVVETYNGNVQKIIALFASPGGLPKTAGTHCFIGSGNYTSDADIINGTATDPIAGQQSATAFNAWVSAMTAADVNGNVAPFATFTAPDDFAMPISNSCNYPSLPTQVVSGSGFVYPYAAAAHIMELTPKSLAFSEPVTGAWDATLNVTAYQM